MTDPTFLSISELGVLLRSSRVSSVELARHFLDRLERLGPTYNAVVTVMRESAIAEAQERDRELAAGRTRGPLHGIPCGVKDRLATDGAHDHLGAAPYRIKCSRATTLLGPASCSAGAVLCANSRCRARWRIGYNQAFCHASLVPGRRPGIRHAGGGLPAGPGRLVGAGLVPFAIGSETWGSIRIPGLLWGAVSGPPTAG